VIYSNGRKRAYLGGGLAIFRWRFIDDGVRFAFYQNTVHGDLGPYYELRETATGRLIEHYAPPRNLDNSVVPDAPRPPWVLSLDKQP
jgi:hypothetical protein